MSIYYPCDKNGNRVPFRTTTTYVTDALGVNANEKVNTLNSKLNGKSSEIINAIPSTISYSNSTRVVAVKNSNNGEICSTKLPSEPGYPPKNVSGITVSNDGDNIYLYWTDPADAYASTVALSVWGGTRVILKAGSAPTHPYDGRIIVNTTTKNQYTVSNKLTISDVLNSTMYYIGVFPFTTDGTFNTSISNVVSTTISRTKVYGFHINPSDSNPSTAVTYLEDAVSKTPVSMNYGTGVFNWGDWSGDEFFIPRPCMVKYDMTVDYYLNPNDYTKKVDGTASDIGDSSYQGNAMMEWGRNGDKIWYKVVPDSNTNGASIYVSNTQVDSGYKCWNFYDASNTVRDHFYTAIYNGSYINNRLRSLSGQTPGVTETVATEISYARSNNSVGNLSGDRWYTETFSDRTLINYLLVLLGKSLDTQTVYGYGYANANNGSAINTGTMNDKGLFWGENTGTNGVKVFGMENWWGNVRRRIAGLMTDSSSIYVKLTPNTADGSSGTTYTTSVSGMINTGVTSSQSSYYCRYYKYFSNGYSVMNDTANEGTNSTYYCDYVLSDNGTYYANVGGYWSYGVYAGAFCCSIDASVLASSSSLGAALSGR